MEYKMMFVTVVYSIEVIIGNVLTIDNMKLL